MTSSNSNQIQKKQGDWKTLVIWTLIAITIRWQVIEPRWIPSGSMLPTLQIKEKILVEKISPKLNNFLKHHPHRESIIVFAPPQVLIDAGYEKDQALIKRIIGIPGDQIEIRNGQLIRNNIHIEEPWIKGKMNYEVEPFTIPEESVWVLGDNRNNSLDSHYWGPLPEKNILGRAVFTYWPIKKFGPIRFPASIKLT